MFVECFGGVVELFDNVGVPDLALEERYPADLGVA